LYSHTGCACLSLADVRFPGQLFRSRLPSPTSRNDLSRLRMPAPAVHKIDPWPSFLSHSKCMFVDERLVEKCAFYSDYAKTLVDWCKVFNHVANLRIHLENCSKFMIIGKASKDLWGKFIPTRFLDCGYCYHVFLELINCNTKASWSV
jgi:hypothetical protein